MKKRAASSGKSKRRTTTARSSSAKAPKRDTKLVRLARELEEVRQKMVESLLRAVRPVTGKEADRPAIQPSRILVVDDNASNRDLLSRRLQRQGHTLEPFPLAQVMLGASIRTERRWGALLLCRIHTKCRTDGRHSCRRR